MNLENNLRKTSLIDAKLKPYRILQMIAEKFGFNMGIPEHRFEENNWQTKIPMRFKNEKLEVTCSISLSTYHDVPAYLYKYSGPVINRDKGDEKHILTESYCAHVIQQFTGCFGVPYQGLMIIRGRGTPSWFPAEDSK